MNYFDDLEFICYGNSRKNAYANCKRNFEYYGLQFIRSGRILVECEDCEPWQDSGPLVFFTAPGRTFSYCTPTGTRDHLFICFRGDRVRRYLASGLLPDVCGRKFPITAPEDFSEALENLLRTLRRGTSISHCKAVLQLENILLQVINQPQIRQDGNDTVDSVRDLVRRIAEHPEKRWSLPEEAAACRISQVHFRRLFTRETGVSPQAYLLDHRVRYAAQLLQSTDMLIKEIAWSSGFGGAFYFSRQFRKMMNMSPAEYRKKFSNKL
ncbi:MAG: helix-turn-helix transcriptional regulator [Lentisphaeria bacterium]|nr:helix-turn-helix transcriptional regulator [Lentisphaeria bacterium]